MSDTSQRHTQKRVERIDRKQWEAECSCGLVVKDLSEPKVIARLGWHIGAKNKILCPSPGKHAYPSRSEAEKGMRATWRMQHGMRAAARVYRCKCGSWHLTRRPR